MSSLPRLWVRLQCEPRAGSTLEECQDRADYDLDQYRFALADGATESWNAGLWARLLVERYVLLREPAPPWATWLPGLRENWQATTERDLARSAEPLDWFLEDRYNLGAYSTFLGVYLRPDADEQGYSWLAMAVGDSCLFQIRNDELVARFPIERAADFNSVPWLIGSRGSDDIPTAHGLSLAGRLVPGDRLWLMTDALALWFLTAADQDDCPWRRLQGILDSTRPTEQFRHWVGDMRDANRLRNDDTTLLAITVGPVGEG